MNQLFQNEREAVDAIKKLLSQNLGSTARDVIHVCRKHFPESKMLLLLQAENASQMQDHYTTANAFETLLANDSKNVGLLGNACRACVNIGENDRAMEYAQRIIDIPLNRDTGLFELASVYEKNNKSDKVRAIIGELSKKEYENPRWKYLEIRLALSTKKYEHAIDLILENRDKLEIDRNAKLYIFFALCKAYDRLGEYDSAWASAEEGHQVDIDTQPFNEGRWFKNFEKIERFMTSEIVDALAEGPKTDVEPLFIVGNPRSGTTLLEQIMSMHPDIVNGGEMSVSGNMQLDLATITDSFHQWPLNLLDMRDSDANILSKQYLDSVALFRSNHKISTDKSLSLTILLGFLSKVLPSSRAILLHRHPLDNAVSCFTTNLLGSGHRYTNSLTTLGNTIVAKKRLADLWLDILPIPTMELHYESLVDNQRDETKRLLKFLDLPWNEDCMNFHKSKNIARTISYDQVNQKMYTSSKSRWKNYEKHLGPLMDIFSDYM